MQYTVKSGDSLTSIARDQLGSSTRWKEIASLNGLVSTIIRIGQTLKLPDDAIAEVETTVHRVPETTTPAVTSFDAAEVVPEITIQAKRIDYSILLLILLGAWMLFSDGERG